MHLIILKNVYKIHEIENVIPVQCSAVSDADQNVNEQYIDYVVEDIVLQEGGDTADEK